MTDAPPVADEATFGFKECHKCGVPLANNAKSITKHLVWHKERETDISQLGTRIDAVVRRLTETVQVAHSAKDAANQARKDAAALLGEIRAVRQEHPTNDALAVAELTDDEIAAYTPEPDPDDWDDDDADELDTVPDATLDPGHVPPAIDRDDDIHFGGFRTVP